MVTTRVARGEAPPAMLRSNEPKRGWRRNARGWRRNALSAHTTRNLRPTSYETSLIPKR